MNNPSIHERSFDLRYYEMDRHGEATPVTLLSLFEETAFTHCEAAGWGVYRLFEAGFGWVLLRGAMEMDRYPAYRESFKVQTWMSAARRFYGEREYRVIGEGGDVIGRARSLWAFFSLERKRPVPVLDDILRAWAPEGTRSYDIELGEIAGPPPGPTASAERMRGTAPTTKDIAFAVRASEIDTNGHVNNVNYLAWALESVADEVLGDRYLASVRGQYKREVTYGSAVRPVAAPEGEGYRHGVYAAPPDGGPEYLAAAAESVWKTRPAKLAPTWAPGLKGGAKQAAPAA
jgi:acyl-ACP thioesterase